jgi:hypothetical protein
LFFCFAREAQQKALLPGEGLFLLPVSVLKPQLFARTELTLMDLFAILQHGEK